MAVPRRKAIPEAEVVDADAERDLRALLRWLTPLDDDAKAYGSVFGSSLPNVDRMAPQEALETLLDVLDRQGHGDAARGHLEHLARCRASW